MKFSFQSIKSILLFIVISMLFLPVVASATQVLPDKQSYVSAQQFLIDLVENDFVLGTPSGSAESISALSDIGAGNSKLNIVVSITTAKSIWPIIRDIGLPSGYVHTNRLAANHICYEVTQPATGIIRS